MNNLSSLSRTLAIGLALTASVSAFAAYPDAKAAQQAAKDFQAKKQFAEAVAAYDEALSLTTNASQMLDFAIGRADALSRANKKKTAVADLFARAEGQGSGAKMRLLSKAVEIARNEKSLAAEARKGNEELVVLHGEAFEAAKNPMEKQRSAFAQASCYDAIGDTTNAIACYHALFAITNGTVATKFAAVNAEAEFLRKHKKPVEALAVASNALAIATADPAQGRLRTAWNGIGEIFYSQRNWDNAVDAFIHGAENAPKPCQIAANVWEAILNVARAGRNADSYALCARVQAIPQLHVNNLAKSYEIEARCLNSEKRFADTAALFERALSDTNFTARADMAGFVKMAAPCVKDGNPGPGATFAFYEKIMADPAKYNLTPKQYRDILEAYAGLSWRSYDRERMKKAIALGEKTDRPFAQSSAVASYLRLFDEMDAFPIPEEKIKIPQDLSDFGVDPNRKIVHAKDVAPGWNPTNATECLQNAIDSDASTVIIDDMGSPWYIWNVTISKEKGSNKKILFKKGVVVLSAPEHNDKNRPGWYRRDMFHLAGPTNLVIVGEGDPAKHDTYIGKYRSRKERLEAGFKYGGHGFGGHCIYTLIKNLYIANCGQDALAWGGRKSFVVDCIFDDNFRQGMSIGASHDCVYKNVTFCNTFGGEPHCGVDVEPYYEVYDCPNHYFLDCKFYNNARNNFLFATSTYGPTTFYFKRCQFEASPNGNIGVIARPGVYKSAFTKAPSKIIFEDCRMDGYTDSNIIQFLSTFFFDVTFRNCVANEVGRFRKTGKARKSPIHLDLDRAIWDGFYPHAGVVTFENFTVNGYRDVPLVSVTDKNGKYGVNTFRGTINHNGKEVDMSTFSYLPPDRDLKECADPDLAALAAPEGAPPAVYHRTFNFNFSHSFYNPTPRYQLFSRGEKGRKATFSIQARGRVRPEAEFKVTAPSGATTSLGKAVQGENAYEYVFPEDGLYRFDANFPPDTKDEEYNPDGFTVISATGVAFAYQADATRLGKVVSLSTGDDYPKYVGYFEVPGGKECCIKMQGGGIEIRDEEGEVVQRLEKADYSGTKCLLFTPKQDAIWSFRCLDGSISMKFFDPLPGIWADDPAFLPTREEDLPFKRIAKEYSSVPEIPTAKLFPLPIKGKVAQAVDEAAAARAEFGKGSTWAKRYSDGRYEYDWKEPAAQTQEQLKAAALMLEALEPVRKMRDMERYAGRESDDLRRYVAFVSLYAPVLALDDASAKNFAASPVVPDDEDYRLKVNAVISPYGAEYVEDGFYYSDYAAVVKLAPFIAARLDALGVNR